MAASLCEIVLKEAAMVRIGSARVGCGNLWEREYKLPDGSIVRGMTARVAIGETSSYVGAGSELSIDGARYRVAGIDKEPGLAGRVRLVALGGEEGPARGRAM